MPNSAAEKHQQNHNMVGTGVYFFFLLDERREHKADYVPSLEGAARAKKDARARPYIESWQGVRRRGEGRRFGLKSRINLKIGSKNGLRWLAGFGLMEAR
jgi:hypothetical protein